jgi:precorrin-2/cobalt-factor-2 C20-methyltransferase
LTQRARGRLFGVGVGPGDPEFVTLKALRVLAAADVVAYPAPETGPSFARSIVGRWLSRGQREIAIRFPMRPGPPPAAVYDDAARAIAAELDRDARVAVLCQGDPLLYGSFCGLLARLGSRYPVEIVPGVSSLGACAAAAAVPLVTRDESLAVIPATLADEKLASRIAAADTAAIVKLGRHLARVKRVLGRLGRLDDAICIKYASLPQQQVRPLAAVDAAPYFSMVLVRGGARTE